MQKIYEKVSLRDFSERDIENKIEWINNPANNTYLHYEIPLNYDKTLQWFLNKDNSKRVDCIIEYEGEPVGVIGLLAIDNQNSKAEYYITVGNEKYKNRGIATKASFLLLEYAFNDLFLNKVYLNVDADNEIACKLYEKIGFLCEGVFCEDMKRNDYYIDRKRYSFLRKNWNDGWRTND